MLLAFPHGGMAGAAGLEADKGARLALDGSTFAPVSESISTIGCAIRTRMRARTTSAPLRVVALDAYGPESNVAGAVTGPTVAIARAAAAAHVRFPVVAAIESSTMIAHMSRALRDRYRARYHEPATVAAWAGYQAARALMTHIERGTPPNIPIGQFEIRIGAAVGEPVEDRNDFFGAGVQLAARLCAFAQPQEILVSHVVEALCIGKGLTFEDLGAVALKGFAAPTPVRRVKWKGEYGKAG